MTMTKNHITRPEPIRVRGSVLGQAVGRKREDEEDEQEMERERQPSEEIAMADWSVTDFWRSSILHPQPTW